MLFDISEEDPSWGLWSLSVLILRTFFFFLPLKERKEMLLGFKILVGREAGGDPKSL